MAEDYRESANGRTRIDRTQPNQKNKWQELIDTENKTKGQIYRVNLGERGKGVW